MAKKKKFPVFWVCFAAFAAIMAIFWICVIANVKKCLVKYENSQPEYTVEKYIAQFKDVFKPFKIRLVTAHRTAKHRAEAALRRQESTRRSSHRS
jgi:hypothetical protein